jgi:hypothetical protein
MGPNRIDTFPLGNDRGPNSNRNSERYTGRLWPRQPGHGSHCGGDSPAWACRGDMGPVFPPVINNLQAHPLMSSAVL